MSLDAAALLARYHAALEPFEAQAVKEMFAPGAVYVSPGVNGRIEGREAIIAAFTAYFAEHPDQKAVDEQVEILGPGTVRAQWRLEATARSSGRRVARRGSETVHFDPQGLIVSVTVEDL